MDIIERLIAAKDMRAERGLRDLLSDAANEIERLREALGPFAIMADEVERWQKETEPFDRCFHASDLFRARDCLKE